MAQFLPLLSVLGEATHLGPLGSGAAAKLVANAALLGGLAVLGEALALADALGLPSDAAFAALEHSPLAAQARRRRPDLARGAYPPRFALRLARKDVDLALAAAAAGGRDARVLAAVRSWFAEAEAHGRGDLDYAALLAQILEART